MDKDVVARIVEVTREDAATLASMLCADSLLRRDLSIQDDVRPTANDFLQKVNTWGKETKGATYAISTTEGAVGIISLRPSSADQHKGKVGFWIGSAHRRKGYCTDALQQLIAVAARSDFDSISGTVSEGNTASCRVWEKLHASSDETETGKRRYKLPMNGPQTPGTYSSPRERGDEMLR
jgi:RimJ/RimL family protein N-acetyltransferase